MSTQRKRQARALRPSASSTSICRKGSGMVGATTATDGEAKKPWRPKGQAWCPYMFLDAGPGRGEWVRGVLRRHYNGHENDIVEFVRGKLHPVDPPNPGERWRPTAARAEVLLPPGGVPDCLLDPQRLVELYAENLLAWQTGLACVIKITSKAATLHEGWERARAYARSAFCCGESRRGLPVILAQHAPFLAGMDGSAPQVHVIALARRSLAGGAFGALDYEVTSDEGLLPLYEEFQRTNDT